jgi:hypothetical protein
LTDNPSSTEQGATPCKGFYRNSAESLIRKGETIMARTRMVTRTINVTAIEAMCVDTLTADVSIKELELTGETFTEEKALKALKKEYETDTLKVVAIQKMEVHEEMYGLKEIDFLKVAQKLDPATRKALENEE